MIYLLDANVLIDASRDYYPIDRVPEFWDWILGLASAGTLKVPREVYEEVSAGNDELAEWINREEVREVLLLDESASPAAVRMAVEQGYAPDLTDDEIESLGRDPFLIAYAIVSVGNRTVVTTERSRPSRSRANRHIPDVCDTLGVPKMDTFRLIRELNFQTGGSPSQPV